MQAQPAFANTNLVTDLSESSGPVEQLKSKFFGPQVNGRLLTTSVRPSFPLQLHVGRGVDVIMSQT